MGISMILEKSVVFMAILIGSTAIPIPQDCNVCSLSTIESIADKMIRYRLPTNTIPYHYTICIEPDMSDENFTWTGESSIDINIVEATTNVTMHAYANLLINEDFTELINANGITIKPIEHIRDDELEFLRLRFEHEIPIGNYTIKLKYEGEDTRDIVGFYKASLNSKVTSVAGTHFQATTARRAFPCWDEPGLKANFQISIKHFPNYTALSNMPVIGHTKSPEGKVLTTFETTPVMSTYLVNFFIANVENVSNEYENVTVWARADKLDKFKHLVNITSKVNDVMELYTGLPYGTPRIGSVLMPMYTSAATEHWGLVSYNEPLVRYNRSTDLYSSKDRVELLVAHELSHSWFGNRVTPAWWDDLWLSEGFASYFQYNIMDWIYDNWGGLELFVVHSTMELSFPLDNDAAISLRWTPVTNKEIRRLFGRTTYKKGAAVLHMFRNVLTDDVFRDAIQKYLIKHSFGAVVSDDLMNAFQEAYNAGIYAGKPLNITEVMTPWLVQTGYPMVHISRNYTTGETVVIQTNALVKNHTTNKWWIPLTYATQSDLNFSSTVPSTWISDKEDRITINGINTDDWIIVNIRAAGYYRVNYDDEGWTRIIDYLNTDNYKNIHILNRAKLIDDANYLSLTEPDRYSRNFYELSKYLSREVEYVPWNRAQKALSRINEALSGTECYQTFRKYILKLMSSFIEKVGFEENDNDTHHTLLSREEIVAWACNSGHSACTKYSGNKILQFIANPENNRMNPYTELWTFCAGLQGFNETTTKEVLEWVYENNNAILNRIISCTNYHEIHRRFLENAFINDTIMNAYDLSSVFDSILVSSDENFNFAVNFLLENLEPIRNQYNLNGMTDATKLMMSSVSGQIKTKARLEKYKQILEADAVAKNETMSSEDVLRAFSNAETRVANSDKFVRRFTEFWDDHISTNNMINHHEIVSSV